MKLVNLTPHPVDLILADGSTAVLAPSGQPLRLTEILVGEPAVVELGHSCVPVVDVDTARGPDALPPRQDGVLYIVAQLVARTCVGRDDFVYPYKLQRDDQGNVIGAAALARVALK